MQRRDLQGAIYRQAWPLGAIPIVVLSGVAALLVWLSHGRPG